MGRLQTIGGNNLFVSNSGDEAADGIYVIQKSLINGKNWYLKDNPDPAIDLAIVYDQAVVNPAINSRWRLIILFNSLPIFNSNNNANNPWETAWDGGLIVNQTTLTNNKASIKKQNLTVLNYSIALVNGIYKLENTLINGRNWYLHSTLLFNIRWSSSINRWQLLSFGGAELSTSTSPTNTPWEATWVSEAIQVSLGSGGKLNLNKKYLYIASGTGLTPNINGLRFYDSGSTYYTNKIFYDETDTYAMWIHPGGYWLIGLIGLAGTLPGGNVFYKNTLTSIDPPTGSYSAASGYSGTVIISTI